METRFRKSTDSCFVFETNSATTVANYVDGLWQINLSVQLYHFKVPLPIDIAKSSSFEKIELQVLEYVHQFSAYLAKHFATVTAACADAIEVVRSAGEQKMPNVVAIKAIVGERFMREGYDTANPLPDDLRYSSKLLHSFDIVEFCAPSGETTVLKHRFKTPDGDFTPEKVAIVHLTCGLRIEWPSGVTKTEAQAAGIKIGNALWDIPAHVLHPERAPN